MTYNSVPLPMVNITRFVQTAMYDEVGDTDWYVTKFDIVAQATLNASYFNVSVGGGQRLTNPADIMNVVWTFLMQPRKQLSVKFNGVELIPQAQQTLPGTVDAMNGPKPQSCQIIWLTNTTFFLIYHVVAHYWVNNQVNPGSPSVTNLKGSNVLYNRWSDTADIDHNNFTTRVREGKFAIRSDNPDGQTVDQLRSQMAVVGIPPGFLRESAHYQVSPNGLTLQFRIIDKQVFKKPPQPAFRAEGSWKRTSPFVRSPYHTAECRIRLEGSPVTPQGTLMAVAMEVAWKKLGQLGYQSPGVPTGISIEAGTYSNWVEVHLSGMWGVEPRQTQMANSPAGTNWLRSELYGQMFGSLGRVAGMALNALETVSAQKAQNPPDGKPLLEAQMFITPVSDDGDGPEYTPAYAFRGNANILLQAAAYYDPSVNQTPNVQTVQLFDNFLYPKGNVTNFQTAQPGTAGLTKEP